MSGNIKMQRIMKKIYLMCAVALLAAVGCNKEIEDGSAPVGSVVLTATVESDATKVGAEVNKETSKVAFTWTKGDAIAVQTSSGYETFTLTGEGGAATGEFTGNATPVANAAAVFPAAAAGSGSDVNLPAEYDYVSGQTNALLYATVTSDNKMSFKHLGGLLSFELKGVPAGSKLVLTAAGMKINGAYDITDGQVNAVATETASESTVTVKFAEKTGSAVVYIPLPVGEYASLKAQLIGSDDVVISEVATTGTKSIARKTVKAMPYIVVDLDEWFVTPAGAGKKDGSSWDNAMGTAELRALLAQPVDEEGNQIDEQAHLKASILDGGTIYMAAGDYYLAGVADGQVKVEFTDYEKEVAMTFLGGYPANLTGTAKEGRNAETNVTAFTGNKEAGIFVLGNQTDITFDGFTFKDAKFSANSGAIVSSAGASGECTLTVNNCKIIDNANDDAHTGAGIQIHKSNVTVTDCYFAGNYARNGSCINLNKSEGTVAVTGCTFENNSTANTSGAVQNGGKTASFTNCIFKKNNAGDWGGGAFHTGGEGANTTFEDCQFIENTAKQGGAVSIEAATCTFTRTSFTNNKASKGDRSSVDAEENSKKEKAGGAIIIRNDAAVCTLNACTFTGNEATNGNGGAIACSNQPAKLTINAGTSFVGNSAYADGGAVYYDGALTINGTSESKVTFSGNKTLTLVSGRGQGGAVRLWTDKSGYKAKMSHVLFTDNDAGQESGSTKNYSNGGAIYVSGILVLDVENCEFTGNRGRNGGCVAYNATVTSTFKNCNFHDNLCRTNDGTGGWFSGAVLQLGNGEVLFQGCDFKNNVCNSSAAVHMNGANVIARLTDCEISGSEAKSNALFYMENAGSKLFLEDCVIRNNKCTAGKAGILMNQENQRLYMNGCLVEQNTGKDRGFIHQAKASSLSYLNRVTFKENVMTDVWGVCMHIGSANACLNNVTSYGNYNSNASTGSVVAFNGDGGWLVVNSTIMDNTKTAVLRTNGASGKMSICNNIIMNTHTPGNVFVMNASGSFKDGGHNVLSCTGAHQNVTPVASDLLSQSPTTLGGSYSANWTGDTPYAVYSWTNNLTGFTPATATDVYNAIIAFDNTNTALIPTGTIGADFWKWLKEIGEVTESGTTYTFKDARGVTRTGTMWPGAYQAN